MAMLTPIRGKLKQLPSELAVSSCCFLKTTIFLIMKTAHFGNYHFQEHSMQIWRRPGITYISYFSTFYSISSAFELLQLM